MKKIFLASPVEFGVSIGLVFVLNSHSRHYIDKNYIILQGYSYGHISLFDIVFEILHFTSVRE